MATYVLVHGGGHGGWCYQPVARVLRSKGHEVYTPTLTGLGERRHLLSSKVDLDLHITDVVNVLQFEDLRNVILAGHSYGGMVITGVADRSADRIGHLMFLDAAAPANGQSLVDYFKGAVLALRQQSRIIDGVELVLFPGEGPLATHGVEKPDQIAWMKGKTTPHPWKCFEQKLLLTNEAALREIPRTHIVCKSSWPAHDRTYLEELSGGRVWEIDTGHDLMISEPEATAEMLLRVAGA
jgi:pimeloyl-ACP methyl ester carboxylesterase